MYQIDYTYSDLPEDEIATHIEQGKAEAEKERKKEKQRMEKARTFRFIGGMC